MTDAIERLTAVVPSGGEQLYAESTGAGEPVVLCHGLGGNHAIWWRQIDHFAQGHRLITWDQRGFGNSTNTTGAAGVEHGASDLRAVLDALQIDRAHLVGQSMGAFVTLRFALDHPDRVQSLVLSTTLAGADPRHSLALRGAVPQRPRRDRHPVVSPEFSRAQPDLVVLYNLISSFGAKPPVATMLESMAAQRFTDAELAELTCPTLFLAAQDDEFCPPEVMQAAAGRVPGAAVTVLAGASHSVYYERPSAWNAAVLDFIAVHAAAPAQ